MTLSGSQYWYVLVWVFVGGGLLAAFFPRKQELVLGKREERWGMVPAVLLAIPYIIWAGYRSNYFGDSLLSSMRQKNF